MIRSLSGELTVNEEVPGNVNETNVEYPCDDKEVSSFAFYCKVLLTVSFLFYR